MFEGTLGVFPGQLFEKSQGFLSKPFDLKRTYQKNSQYIFGGA